LIDAETAALVEEIRADYPGCFACGVDNPVGLHLDPSGMEGGEAVARYRPIEHHGGAGETLHGGLAATVLDEIMVWAGILTHRVLTVTGTMELRFLRPVSVADDIEVRGRVEGRSDRRLRCAGDLLVHGRRAVSARGLYLVARSFD
jgi:acyl-coenzyme A thioesterase PaaI-like protein